MRGYGRNNRDYADRWWGWDRTREHFIVGQESGIARPYDAHKKGNTEEADDVVARYLPNPRVQTHVASIERRCFSFSGSKSSSTWARVCCPSSHSIHYSSAGLCFSFGMVGSSLPFSDLHRAQANSYGVGSHSSGVRCTPHHTSTTLLLDPHLLLLSLGLSSSISCRSANRQPNDFTLLLRTHHLFPKVLMLPLHPLVSNLVRVSSRITLCAQNGLSQPPPPRSEQPRTDQQTCEICYSAVKTPNILTRL